MWRNIFRTTGAVITSSGADTGYSAGDVADHKAFQGWQGNVLTSPQWVQVDTGVSGANADSILIVFHNIVANAGQVTVKADGSNPPTTTRQAAYSPTSDVCDYKAFSAPGAQRYWRIEFSDPAPPFTSKPFLGEILLGMKMTMPEYAGPDLDPFMHDIGLRSERSQGGHHLGATYSGVLRRGVLQFGGPAGLDRAFLTSDWTSFLQTHARKRLPFGLVLDSADTDFAPARWLKVPDDADVRSAPVGNNYSRFLAPLPFEEALRETVS